MALEPADYTFYSKKAELLEYIQAILSDGEGRTVRDVYYALDSRGFEYDYDNDVAYTVKRARRSGKIDPDQILDSSRLPATVVDPGFESPDDFAEWVEELPERYDENFWREQDHYLEVWIEKASLVSVFKPICEHYNIRLEAFGGQWSDSKVYETCQRFKPILDEGKDIRVLYFGDFNYSGLQIPVTVLERMGYYDIPIREDMDSEDARKFDPEWNLPKEWRNVSGTFGLERLALDLDQIREFDLPYNPNPKSAASKSDKTLRKRFKEEITDGEAIDVELNALKEYERDYLEALLIENIEGNIDTRAKAETERRVAERRELLRKGTTVDLHPDTDENTRIIKKKPAPENLTEKTVKVRRRKRD
jgi:hypothetical protein